MKSIYSGIDVTPAMLDAVLVCNSQRQWFRFQFWEDRVFILDRREEYRNWREYDAGFLDEDRNILFEVYANLYGEEAHPSTKKVSLTKAIWAKRFYLAADRSKTYTTGGGKDPTTGEHDRKRNLDGRRYRINEGNNSVHLQEQALIVHRQLMKLQQITGRETISEAEVRTCMEAAVENKILKTKQDPFRIFQYYRGALIKANKLEMFE